MDKDFGLMPAGDHTLLARKSWTAYAGVGFLALLLLGFLVPGVWRLFSAKYSLLTALVVIAFLSYRIAELRAFRLYWNDSGVWVYSGVLPWRKGVRGVKWRDIDDATYTQGMLSWMLRSYSIRVGHRFTRTSELLMTSIPNGHKVVTDINARLQDLVRTNRLS